MTNTSETVADCIFCQIVAGTIPSYKVYEDATTYSFLDIRPNAMGQTLVIPKKHSKNLDEADEETATNVMRAVKKVSLAVQKSTGAEGTNIIVNNKEAAGQVIEHFHVHVIPRFKNDGFTHWESGKTHPETEMTAVADKMRKVLS